MAAAGTASAAPPPDPASARYKDVQLLAINDFHGNLQPPTGSSGLVNRLNPDGSVTPLTVGGVEYLATHLAQAREGEERSLSSSTRSRRPTITPPSSSSRKCRPSSCSSTRAARRPAPPTTTTAPPTAASASTANLVPRYVGGTILGLRLQGGAGLCANR